MISAVALLSVLALFSVLRSQSRDWPNLRGRKERSPSRFYEEFYREKELPEALILNIYSFVEDNFGTMSRLVPSDRFVEVEGCAKDSFDSDTDFLLEATYRRITTVVPEPSAQKEIEESLEAVETLDDLVRTIARYERLVQ